MVFQTASLIQHWYRSCWDVIGWAVGLLRLCSCVQGSLLWDIWLVLGRNLQQMLSWPFQDTSKEEHLLTLPRNIMQMRIYRESSGEAPALSSHGISQESVYQANLQLLQSVCCASIWLLWPCQHWVCPAHLRDSCVWKRGQLFSKAKQVDIHGCITQDYAGSTRRETAGACFCL